MSDTKKEPGWHLYERGCPGCGYWFKPTAAVGQGNAKCPKCGRWTS